jgi:hypothetical protein
MLSKTGNWMVAAGAVLAFLGLCCLPAAFGEHPDRTMLTLGASVFSLGALMMASGMYLKASAATPQRGEKSKETARAVRGGCDRCQTEAPAIHCKVHQVHLCAGCLAEHYDFRACVYVPSTRRATAVRAMAARAK